MLIFQAVLLAHGGLTTLGANTFSMAVAGPIAAFGIYKLCGKLNVNRRVSVFLAAFLGDKTISDEEAEEIRRLIDSHREG